jgi:hypothetical protein
MGDFDQQIEAYAEQLERQAERDAARAERKERAAETPVSAEERERRLALAERRKSIELTRSRVLENLERVGPGRYREQLEQSLATLDGELAGLDA